MTQLYKEARECICGYGTCHRGNWSTHRKTCRMLKVDLVSEKEFRIAELEKQVSSLQNDIKQIRKRKDKYADEASRRVHRTEPERRRIAMRQNWMCAGKECALTQGLEEYDIDHVIPLCLGGTEDTNNLQALCPSCHRKKTDKERSTISNQL